MYKVLYYFDVVSGDLKRNIARGSLCKNDIASSHIKKYPIYVSIQCHTLYELGGKQFEKPGPFRE